jgi:hypothetical protein
MVADTRVREPRLRDCFLLLRQLGVAPELHMLVYPSSFGFPSLEAAVEDCRLHLGDHWDEPVGRAWLEATLERQEDGTLLYQAGEVTAGVLHWKPRT